MNETKFWETISLLDWTQVGKDDAILKPSVDALAEMPIDHIYQFEEILAEKLYNLDGEPYARNMGEYSYKGEDKHFSVDLFLYARCYVVAKGKDYYEKVLADPEKMPRDLEFEAILYLAKEVYEKKTGQEFNYIPKHDYETFNNEEGWD